MTNVYVTSNFSRDKSIIHAVKELAEAGILNIELSGGTTYEAFSLQKLCFLLKTHKLKFLIHNYFPPQENDFVLNLASSNSHIQASTFKIIEQAIYLSRTFSQSLYSVHAGYAYDLSPIKGDNGLFLPKDRRRHSTHNFYKNTERIATQILPQNFRLAVENAFPAYGENDFSMLSGPDEIFDFLSFFDSYSNIGLLLDLGHLNVASYYLGFNKNSFLEKLVREFSHKIFEIHISSNKGELDSHEVSTVDSFEVKFVNEHLNAFKNAAIVLEWHNNMSPSSCNEYIRIVDALNR
jgi:sugar phosphate isomerase/epimerase